MGNPPKRKRRLTPAKPPLVQFPPDSDMVPGVSLLHERLVGRVIIHWARLEAMVQDLIWALFGMDIEDGRLITGRLDIRPKLEMIEVLAPRRMIDKKLQDQLFEAVDLIQGRNGDRNFIVHGNWGTLMPKSVPAAMSLREKTNGPDQIALETFPAERMHAIVRDLETAQNHLRHILRRLGSLPEKPPEQPPPDERTPSPGRPQPTTSKRPRQRKPSSRLSEKK